MGDPLDDATQMGPLVSAAQPEGHGLHRPRQAEGARLVTAAAAMNRGGLFVEPTVFADVTDGMEIAREEVFGPVMAVLTSTPRTRWWRGPMPPLRPGGRRLHPRHDARAPGHRAAAGGHLLDQRLQPDAGRGALRRVKASGVGRENGRAAVEHYTQVKSVYVGMGPVEAPY
jgi:betaine-aldehyde dehydrogenase